MDVISTLLMRPCLVCGTLSPAGSAGAERLCGTCRAGMAPSPMRRVGGPTGLLVGSGALHEGSARCLVHRLKYQGLAAAADALVPAMSRTIPFHPTALVPVPRAMARRVRYGVDPALLLAQRLSEMLDVPVVKAFRAAVWWRAHAGVARSGRRPPGVRATRPVGGSILLVDDVLTTGATLLGAAASLHRANRRWGVSRDEGRMAGVTATSAGTMSTYASTALRGVT